ncbi:pyruvate, water dikinase [Nitrosomonas aestuarii]|uniref:Phosphoenolpyruvate synthase n=1 Tax=Nitrosomonas aestuarii TaxID=52441 RepID=A0A1I4BG82_9PROT|nr:PEP/pyruvate-binding domain-containing protein [Nitrosomonas aestuarii]SFK67845.1 pyruvate, water dikinase [Nitrosomonas aestuarii]
MDSSKNNTWIVSLGDAPGLDVKMVGGKAAALTRMISAGLHVPSGFCITVTAYEYFLAQSDLQSVIQLELGRKLLDKMRWEEIWDAALRIRSAFLNASLPSDLAQAIYGALRQLHPQTCLAVRSSAPGEDSAQRSFAGLHESITNVRSEESVIRAVKTVWASLWSDAALLYRRELALDPIRSRMAVIVQEMIPAKTAGVVFGRDPRNQSADKEIVEAVPGACSNLVDGILEPDRWILQRSSGLVLEWVAGKRNSEQHDLPLLTDSALQTLHDRLGQVEKLFGWPPDMEWAEQGDVLSILQARPITSGLSSASQSDERRWYLTLRPKLPQLSRLAKKVLETLIPELERLGLQLAGENIEKMGDCDLAGCIEKRFTTLMHWREVYREAFIPLAHGVRYLGAYYNDALQPQDPYEFTILLKGQDFLALRRNTALQNLAQHVQKNQSLLKKLEECAKDRSCTSFKFWQRLKVQISEIQGGADFLVHFEQFLFSFMDTTYNGERLLDRPDSLFNLICQVGTIAKSGVVQVQHEKTKAKTLQRRLMEAVGVSREDEAREVLALGQLSWRLRDDDNILLGRIESQFLRALHLGVKRLRKAGRLTGKDSGEKSASLVAQALRDCQHAPIHFTDDKPEVIERYTNRTDKPRQLIGQPASPGLAEGLACVVNGIEDFRDFQRGDILVCESIQPTMTHLVLLASAIVEQRGGMLIHGAIIARELGIPCVNGICSATKCISSGEQLTVDGYLGIVTLGAPDFELENHAYAKHID